MGTSSSSDINNGSEYFRVALLGDSTLDNVVWTGKAGSVPELLRQKLDARGEVANLAADTFTTKGVMEGALPMISWESRRDAADPFPTDFGKRFKPLDHLRAMDPPPSHVVVSVGGNDVRECLGNLNKLPVALQEMPQNLMRICEEVSEVCPNIILCLLYRPAIKQDEVYHVYERLGMVPLPTAAAAAGSSRKVEDKDMSLGVQKVETLFDTVYKPFLQGFSAKFPHAAVADFTNSFDPHDDALYDHQIEPNAKGSAVIANLLAHIAANHDFDSTGGAKSYHMNEDGEIVATAATKWKLFESAA